MASESMLLSRRQEDSERFRVAAELIGMSTSTQTGRSGLRSRSEHERPEAELEYDPRMALVALAASPTGMGQDSANLGLLLDQTAGMVFGQ